MKKNESILHLIPFGYINAISRNELRIKAGVSDRKMRQMIEDESTAEHPILNLQDGRGYFQPTKEDLALIRIARAQEHDRAKNIMKRASAIDKFYKTLTGEKSVSKKNEIQGQVDIFNYMDGMGEVKNECEADL